MAEATRFKECRMLNGSWNLRCMVFDTPKQWSKWLSLAEYWYNTSYHRGLKMSPFQALYGYVPPHLSSSQLLDTPDGNAKDYLLDRQSALKLQSYKQSSIALRKNLKLSSRFYGPVPDLPDSADGGPFQLFPVAVEGTRSTRHNGTSVNQILVRWGAADSDLSSWEDEGFIRRSYPAFSLNPWGQGLNRSGGNVVGTRAVEAGRLEKEGRVDEMKKEKGGGGGNDEKCRVEK